MFFDKQETLYSYILDNKQKLNQTVLRKVLYILPKFKFSNKAHCFFTFFNIFMNSYKTN